MRHILYCLPIVALILTSCTQPTAAGRLTMPGTGTIAAAQLDQYRRDARATQAAQDATIEARVYALASTASVATQTQIAVTQRADAQATAARITQQAVSTQAARDAILTAVHDTDATATAVARIRADATETQVAGVAATGTAVVVHTQTALTLRTHAAVARRNEIANWLLLGLFVVLIYLVWLGGRIVARRLAVAKYGPYQNPLVLLPNGAVYNPLNDMWSGDPIPPELQAQLATGLQHVLALQAQHSPHAPGVATKRAFSLGPVSTSAESMPVTETVTVGPVDKPAIEAPKEKLHMVYVQGQAVSEPDRDLCDLREMVERGALQGFTRARWLGHKYQSGHDGTRERYERIIDILTQAGVIEPEGRTWRLAVPVDQALAALNLESVRLG